MDGVENLGIRLERQRIPEHVVLDEQRLEHGSPFRVVLVLMFFGLRTRLALGTGLVAAGNAFDVEFPEATTASRDRLAPGEYADSHGEDGECHDQEGRS